MDHESGGYLVRVNDQGFRSEHEFVREKTPGTRRVLLFGDSFTAGDGVRNRDRYGDVLEELIPGLEVYNFGLPGSGTDQQYLIFREWADRFEHDLVIVAVLVGMAGCSVAWVDQQSYRPSQNICAPSQVQRTDCVHVQRVTPTPAGVAR